MPSLIKNKMNSVKVMFGIALMIICYGNDLSAQGTDILSRNRPGFFVSVGMGPSRSAIETTTSEVMSQLVSTKAKSSFGSIAAGYLFSRNIGLSAGVGYNSYSTRITTSSYSGTGHAIDDESEPYDLSISVINLEEVQKISSLNIPFNLILRLPLSKILGFYFEPGLNISIPVSKVFSSNGTFTFKGYYPAYNVTFENLPTHNFPSSTNLSDDGDLLIKSLWMSVSTSGGIDISIQRKIQVLAGISYFTSLSNIAAYASPEKFQLSTGYPEINSTMGSSSKTTLSSMGLNIRLRYLLK